jgi:hypothetical protein
MSAIGERNDLGLDQSDRLRILSQYRTIAMVGLSSNYYNASSFAAIYLDANGYDIVPVNPAQAGKTILGRPVYAPGPSRSSTCSGPPTRRRPSPSRPWPSGRRSCGSSSR